jgi:hypothetical protein
VPQKSKTRSRTAQRKRILEVAKEAFTRSGPNASLDDIARTDQPFLD